MFKDVSIAEFEADGRKALFIIDNDISVEGVQNILNRLMHFCVDRLKEAENEEAQRKKDEEASAETNLDAISLEEVEELQQVTESIEEKDESCLQ